MDKYVGDHEHKFWTFRRRLNLHASFSMNPKDWEELDNTVQEYIPEWLTTKMSEDILHTIDCFKYANITGELVVYIPVSWVERRMRVYYRDAKIFGIPLRLNEYAETAVVGLTLKERPIK